MRPLHDTLNNERSPSLSNGSSSIDIGTARRVSKAGEGVCFRRLPAARLLVARTVSLEAAAGDKPHDEPDTRNIRSPRPGFRTGDALSRSDAT
jgi:hypothetical protein